jgi:hypothetical protein
MIISYWRCSNNEMAVLYINPYYTQHHMVKITLFCSEFKLILYLLTMYIYCVYIYWQCTYIVFIFTDNVHILCLYLLTMYRYCVYIYWQCTDIVFIFTDNVHILCLSCNAKKSKTTAKLSGKSRINCCSNCFQWCPLWHQHLYCYCFSL